MKTIKFLTLTILGWLCSLSLWAYDFEVNGLYYKVTSLEKLEVEVSQGDWTDDSSADVKYKGDIVIPETVNYKGRDFKVTGIGVMAFSRCTGLTSIVLGNVQNIKYSPYKGCLGAFEDCTGLTSIDLGNVHTIGNNAFKGCTKLTSIDFKTVQTIESSAFSHCSGLTTIDFGQVQTIGTSAFSRCSGLTTIDFGQVQTIGSSAFSRCSGLTTIDFGQVQTIESSAFSHCSGLTTIDLKNIHTIGYGAFTECTGLNSIDLGNVQTIRNNAFKGCTGLTNVDFKNVKTIEFDWGNGNGSGAFYGCTGLTAINLRNVQNIGVGTFEGCTSLSSVDFGGLVSIPEAIDCIQTQLTKIFFGNISNIKSHAFSSSKNLTSIDLKNVQAIGEYAFYDCTNLISIKTSQKEPPILGTTVFNNKTYINATLEVPTGCKGDYLQAEGWKNFFTIVESGEASKIPLNVSCSEGGQVDFTNYSVSGSSTTAPFHPGEKVRMTFTAHKGYVLQSVVVDGKNVTSEITDNTYTITMDTEKSVKVTFTKIPIFLTLQQADNGQINLKVEGGKSYQFKLEAAEGWKINTVTFNAVDVTANLDADNNYETPAITENSKLIVSFELVVPSAITDLSIQNILVKGVDGQIMIVGANEGDCIMVYTAEGAMVASEISNGMSHQINLEPGHVYIVKVGDRTFKIAL